MNLKKLLPETLGGEHYYNWWNLLYVRGVKRRLVERRERPFAELVRELNPRRILEIGVAEGWGAERMVRATDVPRDEIEYYGFDLFRRCEVNTFVCMPMRDIERKLMKLGVRKVWLYAGDSRETLPAIASTLPKMDLVHIDGGKECTKDDWENVQPLIHPETVVVIDDYNDPLVRRIVDGIDNPPYHVRVLDGFTVKAMVSRSRGK